MSATIFRCVIDATELTQKSKIEEALHRLFSHGNVMWWASHKPSGRYVARLNSDGVTGIFSLLRTEPCDVYIDAVKE